MFDLGWLFVIIFLVFILSLTSEDETKLIKEGYSFGEGDHPIRIWDQKKQRWS